MTPDDLNQALTRGGCFLLSRQSPDGAWRSERYGNFKNGDALTPLALLALWEAGSQQEPSLLRAVGYLANMVRPDGRIDAGPFGIAYPVYTAALAVQALFHPRCPIHEAARSAWLTFLRSRQLTEALGWSPQDREYGGWGYSQAEPIKPSPGEPSNALVESNLSATTFALDALHVAGSGPDDGAFQRALCFVPRCQNFGEDPTFDDGGFFFMENDPIRNKAGVAGLDRHGRERYASYGSMTADGLRCLVLGGMPNDSTRVQAAHQWLEGHFDLTLNPGRWGQDRRDIQVSIHFYYLLSLARTWMTFNDPARALEMIEFLVPHQRADGSWINGAADVREDDPIVATSLALMTLAVCRRCLAKNAR